MNTSRIHLTTDGMTLTSTGALPRESAVRSLEAALRRRRDAYAAYGKALTTPTPSVSFAERDGELSALREAIRVAQVAVERATDALEALL